METLALNSYLTFTLGDESFAVHVGKVMEILEVPNITKIPRAPEYMRGVLNLRGNVLPVIDARLKFGLPRVADTQDTCVVVLDLEISNQPVSIGMVVDSVQEVMDIITGDVQPAPSIGARYKPEFIAGMVKSNDRFIMMLELEAIFALEDANILAEVTDRSDDDSDKQIAENQMADQQTTAS